ncbi:unnamed protein product [Chrysoparadoxa australica]
MMEADTTSLRIRPSRRSSINRLLVPRTPGPGPKSNALPPFHNTQLAAAVEEHLKEVVLVAGFVTWLDCSAMVWKGVDQFDDDEGDACSETDTDSSAGSVRTCESLSSFTIIPSYWAEDSDAMACQTPRAKHLRRHRMSGSSSHQDGDDMAAAPSSRRRSSTSSRSSRSSRRRARVTPCKRRRREHIIVLTDSQVMLAEVILEMVMLEGEKSQILGDIINISVVKRFGCGEIRSVQLPMAVNHSSMGELVAEKGSGMVLELEPPRPPLSSRLSQLKRPPSSLRARHIWLQFDCNVHRGAVVEALHRVPYPLPSPFLSLSECPLQLSLNDLPPLRDALLTNRPHHMPFTTVSPRLPHVSY